MDRTSPDHSASFSLTVVSKGFATATMYLSLMSRHFHVQRSSFLNPC